MWTIVGTIACILGALLPLVARPDVLRVPSEWETLSAAFRQLENNDTILASPGLYEESVTVPPLNFVLMSDVVIDSSATEFVVLDPTNLPGSDSLCILTLTGGSAKFRDIVFRNRVGMTEGRSASVPAGIVGDSSELLVEFTRCVFDSVLAGVTRFPSITFDSCRFIGSLELAANTTSPGQIHAFSTWFDGASGALVASRRGGEFEDCLFTHSGPLYFLLGLGDSLSITNCRFVATSPLDSRAIWLRPRCGSIVRNCSFENIRVTNGAILDIWVSCFDDPVSNDCALKLIDNEFIHCGTVQGASLPCGEMIRARCTDAGSGFIADMSANYIDSTFLVTADASGITTNSQCSIEHNTFGDALTPNKPQIHFYQPFGPDTVLVRNNSFARDFYSIRHVYAGATIDARNCWWGDPSGPYHGELNPNGLGAQVDNHVMFIPWLTVDPDSSDTTEVSLDPSDPYLPELYSLSAFPNPFNSLTQINIDVAHPNIYDVVLFDITGREIEKIYHGKIDSHHTLSFESHALPSGTYFLQLRAGHSAYAAAKLVLLR
jgi:hypothetical protein